jgi:uncharacterized RDD family membrane protein YckC
MSPQDNAPGQGTNPFAPPVAQVQDMAPASGELAGRGARLGAAIIDGVAFGLLAWAITGASGVAIFTAEPVVNTAYVLAYGGSMVLFLALQAWLLHQRSQTLGKIALGIRIVRTDGSRATVGRLVGLRLLPTWFVGLVPVVGPLISLVDSLLIFRDSRRCLHDDIADTIVVRV